MKKLMPIHPGEILKHEFMEPLELTAYRLAIDLRVPRSNIEKLVRGERPVSAELALRLARRLQNSAEFWLNLQSHYELEIARDELQEELDNIQPT